MAIPTYAHRGSAKLGGKPVSRVSRATGNAAGSKKMKDREESESGALIRQCLDVLRERFPGSFGERQVPLKVGIGNDVHQRLEGSFGRKVIEAAIGRHVRTRSYLDCLVLGASRLDLEGRAVGRVSEAEHARAVKQANLMDTKGGLSQDGLAKKNRAQLLRRFESSSKPLKEFADLVEMDETDLKQRLDASRQEREERQAEARVLVERWRKSGMSRNQFCKTNKIKPRKLETALERMGVVLESSSQDERQH